jgi:hypothetical protein
LFARDAIAAQIEYEDYFRRGIRNAQLQLPADTNQIEILRFQKENLRDAQRNHAEHLCDTLRGLDQALTSSMAFGDICDLLGVNQSHRAEALEHFSAERGAVTTIVFIAGLEDSATSRSGRRIFETRSGPLFQIYMAGFYRQVRTTPGLLSGIGGTRASPSTPPKRNDQTPTLH